MSLDERHQAGSEAREETLNFVRLIAAREAEQITAIRQLLRLLAVSDAVREGPSRCNAFAATLLTQSQFYANVGAAAPDGDLYCSAVPVRGRVNVADRTWFAGVVQTRSFSVGDYEIDVTRKATQNFGYPILDPSGKLQGVAFVALDLDWFAQVAADSPLSRGADFLVLDRAGTILIRYPNPEKWTGRPMPDTPLTQTLRRGRGEGTVDGPGDDGIRRVYAFAPLGGAADGGGAYVVLGVPTSVAFADANRTLAETLAGLWIVAVLAFAAALEGVNRFVLRGVNNLLAATARLRTGDLAARAGPPYSQGELGTLARAFDDMAASLQARTAELQAHAAELEQRVSERTTALREAKDEADRANRAKSEFLSRMSHELRTPLNAVLGFAQLLEMDSLNAEQRESVEHILKGGRHLLTLINEVLDIARIEAGRLAISVEPVPLQTAVQETLDLMRPLAAEKQVALTGGVDGTRARYVRADNQRLKQVVLNLVSNAIKYGGGGAVTLSCEDIPDGRVRIKVTDTGPGIPPEKMARLFTPFERLGSEHTGIEGTGLGLALSKGLAEAMGGALGVESAPGKGSAFWVDLPAAESPLEQLLADGRREPSAAAPAAAPRTATILYIEDNLSNFQLVKHVLSQRPQVKLLAAMQGGLGLELARRHQPDLILLDLHLPDIQGDEVLRRLKEAPETRAIPVVMISADATAGRASRLVKAGARAYLTKPLDVKQFLVLVDKLLTAPEVARGAG